MTDMTLKYAKDERPNSMAYLDCFSGISGDMFLAALLDAGMNLGILLEDLKLLPLKGYEIQVGCEKRGGIKGTRLEVKLLGGEPSPRGLSEIKQLINSSTLAPEVKTNSISVFELLAQAEAKVHGVRLDEVHFHEVGAVDSIVDIVGVCISIHHLKISKFFASPVPLGSGFIKSDHGTLPVPAPATVELLKGVPILGASLPGRQGGVEEELVTPTGAALLRHFVQDFGPIPPMQLEKIGWGVGARDLPERPNLLRVLIGREGPGTRASIEVVVLLETNVDDVMPETLGFLMERLFEAGSLDVAFVPIQMKKNRPGIQIQVMCFPGQEEDLARLIFMETGTLGIRVRRVERRILARKKAVIESPWGSLEVKRILLPDGSRLFAPEYEACKRVAVERGIPFRSVLEWVASLNRCPKDHPSK